MSDYYVFHDESKEDGYWHIFYWVPVDKLDELVCFLKKAQKNSGFKGKRLSFKELHSRASFRNAEYWLSILKASLHGCKPSQLCHVDLGRPLDSSAQKRVPDYAQFADMPCCKLSVFYLPKGHRDLDLCRDDTARIETTFRMGLKGGGHYFFSDELPCRVKGIWLDRERHYKRPLEKIGLMERLSSESRSYLDFHAECGIEGERVPEGMRLVLDAVDILLGSFRYDRNDPINAKGHYPAR